MRPRIVGPCDRATAFQLIPYSNPVSWLRSDEVIHPVNPVRFGLGMITSTPPAEVDIDTRLVRALLAEQHPDLCELPLELIEAGWDNMIYRLGPALAVRIPRRKVAADLVEKELRWLRQLAP